MYSICYKAHVQVADQEKVENEAVAELMGSPVVA